MNEAEVAETVMPAMAVSVNGIEVRGTLPRPVSPVAIPHPTSSGTRRGPHRGSTRSSRCGQGVDEPVAMLV